MGASEGVIVVLGTGIVAMGVLNAGLMLKRRWLSMFGLAGTLGYLAFLIRGMIEAIL